MHNDNNNIDGIIKNNDERKRIRETDKKKQHYASTQEEYSTKTKICKTVKNKYGRKR